MPGAPSPRSSTASISLRPTPAFWPSGSTVIGPTPRIGPRSSRKLEPTIRPSISATTPQTEGCGIHVAINPVAASSTGKSLGKRWWSWMAPKASKQIRAQASASPGAASRIVTSAAAAVEVVGVIARLLPPLIGRESSPGRRSSRLPRTMPPDSPRSIFLRFLKFGALAWGGPAAQIAMIKRECVDEEGWVSEETFKKTLAVYQVLPGPEAHELCVYFGRLRGGKLGGFLAGLGFMLPGFLLMLGALGPLRRGGARRQPRRALLRAQGGGRRDRRAGARAARAAPSSPTCRSR